MVCRCCFIHNICPFFNTLIIAQRPHPNYDFCLILSEKVDNLLVAGRCISTDHVALGSTRIMPTCMALGEAAGAVAMLSLHEEVLLSELDAQMLREQLRKQGAVVDKEGVKTLNEEYT
ncbi:MAG: FAD-dependent oxidoreductase [Anaerolineae bacterium]|nr:FAD-dependent oxidoreductase [Anaerolineae bacterium]